MPNADARSSRGLTARMREAGYDGAMLILVPLPSNTAGTRPDRFRVVDGNRNRTAGAIRHDGAARHGNRWVWSLTMPASDTILRHGAEETREAAMAAFRAAWDRGGLVEDWPPRASNEWPWNRPVQWRGVAMRSPPAAGHGCPAKRRRALGGTSNTNSRRVVNNVACLHSTRAGRLNGKITEHHVSRDMIFLAVIIHIF